MYLLKKLSNIDAVVQDLKNDRVTEYDQFGYYLFLFVNMRLFYPPEEVSILAVVLMTLVTIWGIWSCYQQNKLGDNRLFLTRIVSLSAAVLLRVLVPLALVIYGLRFLPVTGITVDILQAIACVLAEFIFYVYLRTKIAQVAGSKITGIL